jgi:hypothetical protein
LNQKFELLQKSGFLVQITKRNNEMRQVFLKACLLLAVLPPSIKQQ